MRRGKLRRRFPVAIIGLSAASFAVLGALAVREISAQSRARAEQAAVDLAALKARDIASFFAERGRVATTMLASPALEAWFEGYREFRRPLAGDREHDHVHGFFQRVVASDPTIVSAFFATASTGEYFREAGRVEREGYDTRERWWWAEALEEGSLYVTAPGVDAGTGRTMVTVQTPVRRADGTLLGVGGIDVSVDTVAELVRAITLDGAGDAFLVDQQGRLVSFPGDELSQGEVGARLDVRLAELDRREPDSAGFARLMTALGRGQPGLERLTWRGEERLVAHAPVRLDAPRIAWSLGLMLPEAGLRAAARRTQAVAAGAILLAVAAIALVTLLVTRRVDLLLMSEERHRAAALAEANARLREADRMKSQFLASMSHELRTPLNSVIGFAQVLRSRLEGQLDPRYLRFLDNISSSGEHLLALINDILDLSKVEAGRLELHPEPLDVLETVAGVVDIVRGAAGQRRVRLEVTAPPDLPPLEADPVRFKQVVFNLLSNAVKFSPEGGAVQVAARALAAATSPLGEPSLEVAVVDHGIGIAEQDRELVFEAFRQVDRGPGASQQGTGLGLALVRRLVALHRGEVALDSELGRGSTFTVTLPLSFRGVTEASGAFPAVAPVGLERPLILVVEDDPAAFRAIRATLEPAGFRVAHSPDGTDAVTIAVRDRPALVVLDVVLPTTDGWTVLRQLRERRDTGAIPVVITSVLPNHELGLALGADAYFSKPLDAERFLERVRQLLPAGAGGSARLLVVDDEEAVHELLDEVLGGAGFTVEHARSGEEGLEMARRSPPDLVVLDLMMDGLDGFEVAAALHGDPRTARVPVVVLTAKQTTAAERERLRGSIEALVDKADGVAGPLLPVVRAVLARQRRPA